jgi:hypothetical protein
MSTANPLPVPAAPVGSRHPSSTTAQIGSYPSDSALPNGHHHHHQDSANTPTNSAASMQKKTKAKKMTDPNEASKLIAAKISQLELDAAGEKDQEAEIGGYISHLRREYAPGGVA